MEIASRIYPPVEVRAHETMRAYLGLSRNNLRVGFNLAFMALILTSICS
jgi:hypothetical protein